MVSKSQPRASQISSSPFGPRLLSTLVTQVATGFGNPLGAASGSFMAPGLLLGSSFVGEAAFSLSVLRDFAGHLDSARRIAALPGEPLQLLARGLNAVYSVGGFLGGRAGWREGGRVGWKERLAWEGRQFGAGKRGKWWVNEGDAETDLHCRPSQPSAARPHPCPLALTLASALQPAQLPNP